MSGHIWKDYEICQESVVIKDHRVSWKGTKQKRIQSHELATGVVPGSHSKRNSSVLIIRVQSKMIVGALESKEQIRTACIGSLGKWRGWKLPLGRISKELWQEKMTGPGGLGSRVLLMIQREAVSVTYSWTVRLSLSHGWHPSVPFTFQ